MQASNKEKDNRSYCPQFLIFLKKVSYDDGSKPDNISSSDSGESEAEIWASGIQSPVDDKGKQLIIKKQASLKRKTVRQIKKRLAESRLMKQQRSKKVGKIISECPDIGQENENFVRQCGVGADM